MATSAAKSGPKPVNKAASEDEAAAPAPKSKKKRFLLLGLVLLLAVGAGAAWFFLGHGAQPAAAHAPAPAKPPVFAILEPFTVNLQAEAGEQYLQIAITVQVPDQAQADLIKQYMPMVRNRLLVLLSSKKIAELSTTAGKEALAAEIMARLRQPFAPNSPPQVITSVFFTSFVIQ